MITVDDISSIFEKISEEYEEPIPIGGRCESRFYYRTEELSEDDLNACAEYVAFRLSNVVHPSEPDLFLKLPGGDSFFSEKTFAIFS